MPHQALGNVHHFHMDSQLTPRQEGVEESVTRDWIVGCDGNATWQSLEVMTSQFQTAVAGQLTTLETQAQRCRFTRGQQSQDLERYLQNVRTTASTTMQMTPSVPGAVAQVIALEAEVQQQEAQMSFMRMQYDQAELEATQQGFLLKDINRRAEFYMSGMVQGARQFQMAELQAREEDRQAFEVHCRRDLHQAYEHQLASIQTQWQNQEIMQVQRSEQLEKDRCQALENQTLQLALGKQQHELASMWEQREQMQIRDLRKHLQDAHELAASQLKQEGVAELRLAELWKDLAEKQG